MHLVLVDDTGRIYAGGANNNGQLGQGDRDSDGFEWPPAEANPNPNPNQDSDGFDWPQAEVMGFFTISLTMPLSSIRVLQQCHQINSTDRNRFEFAQET